MARNGFLKNHRKDITIGAGLFVASQLLCVLLVWSQGMFGSQVDWLSQHSVLPDYFRQHFYETGDLFPDMAWNIGGGQNMYNLSYYGLYSPIVLISFFLPFVPMDWYIMISSMLLYGSSVVLFYVWQVQKQERKPDGFKRLQSGERKGERLGRQMEDRVLVLMTSVLFLLATPLLYHFYNQLMFVNYMPFLLLGFIGTDRYIENHKRGFLLVGVFCMILTSFFFSVGGLLALGLYMLGHSMRWKERFCYVGNLILAMLLAGFLLVPTALSLLDGRGQTVAVETVVNWIVPRRFLYSPYGLGLTMISVFALIGAALGCKGWERRIQVWGMVLLFVVPLAAKLLNGGLYAKDKVFLPFLPLMCEEIGLEMQRIRERDWKNKRQLGVFVLQCVLAFAFLLYATGVEDFEKYRLLLWIDAGLLLLTVLLYGRFPKVPYPLLCACGILLLYQGGMHQYMDNSIPVEDYQSLGLSQCEHLVEATTEADTGWYRTEVLGDGRRNLANINRVFAMTQHLTSIYSSGYNGGYAQFRKENFGLNMAFRNGMMENSSDNPIWLSFMGVRYVIGTKSPAGYEQLEVLDKETKNEAVGTKSKGSEVAGTGSKGSKVAGTGSKGSKVAGTGSKGSEVAGTGSKGSEVAGMGNWKVYVNRQAAPLCYATTRVIDRETYERMEFPDTQTALLQYAVVENTKGESLEQQEEQKMMEETSLNLPLVCEDGIQIQKAEGEYEISVKKETTLTIPVSASANQNLLAVTMEIENLCPNKDMHIRINGQTNRLTAKNHEYANQNQIFHFVVSPDASGCVKMQFSKGNYRIHNLQAYVGCLEQIREERLYEAELSCEEYGPKGDCLKGTIALEKQGWLITSIPYDKGFTLYIDGKKTETKKVNTTYLGAEISSGKHEIQIVYHASGKKAGMSLSVAGLCLLGLTYMTSKRKQKQ